MSGVMAAKKRARVDPDELERVCEMARRWAGRAFSQWNNVEDIQAEAVLGVIRAAETYDPEKASFSTYGIMWAKAKAIRYRDKEVAHQTGHTHNAVRKNYRDQKAMTKHFRIDGPVPGLESEGTLHEVLADPDARDPSEVSEAGIVRQEYERALRACAAGLSTQKMRNAAMLMLNTDLGTREIGRRVGLSHERVAQVRNRAYQMVRDALGGESPQGKNSKMCAPPGRPGPTREVCELPRCYNLAHTPGAAYCVSHEPSHRPMAEILKDLKGEDK